MNAEEALSRYERASELVRELREEWDRLKRPLLATGSMGQTVPHPLIGMIQQAERDADRFARAVKPTGMGRPTVAVPGVAKSPAAQLRAVK